MSTPGFTQDMPPAGGYPQVHYRRNLPQRGPSGLALVVGVTAVCTFGFWQYARGMSEKRELKRENTWSRIYLVPLLQAETDRDTYRRQQASLQREKEIMKDVPGWEVGKSVYHHKPAPSSFILFPSEGEK
ncbi:uncharacterized protein VTP21DRAFT_2876 [Calcarisporiella thermophila]|uniref:uncharacterized protein n=1 Tax=Calcarisporiella thermophila TaxID=911321 RepID=UPI0037441234